MLTALGALLLVAAVVIFILQPLITGQRASLVREDDERSEAEALRRVKLLALRDVEYDYATGKLDEEDYASLKAELSAEALEALEMSEREASGVGTEALEREIAAVRAGLESGTTCTSCGFANDEGSRFCASCGHPLEADTGAETSTGRRDGT